VEVSGQRIAKRRHRWTWTLAGISLCVLLAGTLVVVRLVIARAEPILRARVIETLSNRFQSRVELASLDVSVMRELEVSGSGLKIYGDVDPTLISPGCRR